MKQVVVGPKQTCPLRPPLYPVGGVSVIVIWPVEPDAIAGLHMHWNWSCAAPKTVQSELAPGLAVAPT